MGRKTISRFPSTQSRESVEEGRTYGIDVAMKVIIAGPRDFHDYEVMYQAIRDSGFAIIEVVSGKATGADALGERWALESRVPLKEFPANWVEHGKAAGPIRNGQMADYADALIAVWDGKSNTGNMIKQARAKGLDVYVHTI